MCGVATIAYVIWYRKQRREWARRSSSGCQSIQHSCDTWHTVVLVSNPSACSSPYFLYCLFLLGNMGSHTEAAYSRCGSTSVL